jgi:putative aldouronate transport system substrate-binding protein
MQKRRKWITASMAAVLSLAVITGCSSTKDNNTASVAPVVSTGNESGSKLKIVNGKIDPPVTFTTIRGIDPTAKYKNGETIENNIHTKWAKDVLGVDIKTLWSAQIADGSFDTKLKLMLSSGEKLPDVLSISNKDVLSMFIDSGKVMSVENAFEKYAGKAWKDAIAEQPTAWLPVQRGKEKFGIPLLQPTTTTEPVLWIRKDWLDKLGLQAPKSLADLETIMDAFTNKDPDGNGKKDTIALDYAMKDQLLGYYVGDITWLFGSFGTIPGQWNKDTDGKLSYGSIQPGAKQALSTLKTWRDKGYIAGDIALHDWNKIVENVSSGKVGIVAGPYWFPVYPGSMVYAKDPKADYEPYSFPAGPDGKTGQFVGDSTAGAFLINKDISPEALEAFFHYMNALWDASNSDDPFVLKGFQENYDYIIQDGKAITANDKVPGGTVHTQKYTLQGAMPQPMSKYVEVYRKLATGEKLSNNELSNLYAIGGDPNDPLRGIEGKANLIVIAQKKKDMPNYFTGPTTATQASRGEFLKKLELDTFTQIIYGKVSVDEFDNMVKKWKSTGGDEVTKEVNAWYDSVK